MTAAADIADAIRYGNLASAAYNTDPVSLDAALSWCDFKRVDSLYVPETDTHGYVAVDVASKEIFVGFRGTTSFVNLRTDVCAILQPMITFPGEVHRGIHMAWCSVAPMVDAAIAKAVTRDLLHEDGTVHITVGGHSLGGGIATIALPDIISGWESTITYDTVVRAVTLGSPRVSNKAFANAFDSDFSHLRVVHEDDLIPQIPALCYHHTGRELRIADNGAIRSSTLSWFRRFLGFDRLVLDDVDGCALGEHRVGTYLAALIRAEKLLTPTET